MHSLAQAYINSLKSHGGPRVLAHLHQLDVTLGGGDVQGGAAVKRARVLVRAQLQQHPHRLHLQRSARNRAKICTLLWRGQRSRIL